MKRMFNPSLMCMDLINIKEQMQIVNKRADLVHVDIMDGHYVKNITLSPDFVKAIKPICKVPIDCHLMVTNPEDYVEPLAKAGANYICPQSEVINAQAFRIIDQIKSYNCKAGVVINPATDISIINQYIHKLDKITVMSVDPGFAGQTFIPEVLVKIKKLKELKEKHGYKYLIEIDGSCNANTFKRLYEHGVEVYIVGSSGLFNLDKDLNKAWDLMEKNFDTAIA